MCMGGGGSAPMPPPLPPPPPPVPTPIDQSVVNARQETRNRAAIAAGRNASIMTDPNGLTATDSTKGPKSLLGN